MCAKRVRDPAGNRTPNRQLRRLMLYPIELPDQVKKSPSQKLRRLILVLADRVRRRPPHQPSQHTLMLYIGVDRWPPTPRLRWPKAEKGGFEPPVRFDPYGGLANRWFKPLTHLSKDSLPVLRGRLKNEVQI